ncbi:MAG: c-type cytochrome [Alphaproteobacteria bacterium]
MGATGVVLERMEAMKEIASAVKAIKGQLSSDSYSSNVVIENASIIEKHAGKNFINLFPKGSEGGPSEASSSIWQDWDGFAKISDDLQTRAIAIKDAASDQKPLKEPFTNLVKTCGACHKKFREKK